MGSARVAVAVNRFEVYLVTLNPTVGTEIRKTRPCLVVSPDGQVVLDQMRAIDTARLVRRLGRIDRRTGGAVLAVLQEMFAP